MALNRPQKAKQQAKIILLIAAIIAISYALLTFTDIKDIIKNIGYQAPAEVAGLVDKLPFTDKAKTIFYATRPALESRDDFNEHCDSHNVDISVLGCYSDNRIYLYNVDSAELPNVVESTATHELLHAAWERLNIFEKTAVEYELEKVYQSNQNLLSGDLELYDTEDRMDELHSRIGTEIADLPESLERHYAKYFTDQDAVVALYNSYHEPFEKLKTEIEELSKQLEAAKLDIDTRTKDYYQKTEDLNKRIDEFNNCADTTGCFSSYATFNARRRELVAEQSALEVVYNNINSAINDYNTKVTEYNNNILRSETLENMINSNAPVEDIN